MKQVIHILPKAAVLQFQMVSQAAEELTKVSVHKQSSNRHTRRSKKKIGKSCGECRRRKIRCDGRVPCFQCQGRGAESNCFPSSESNHVGLSINRGRESSQQLQDPLNLEMNGRITRPDCGITDENDKRQSELNSILRQSGYSLAEKVYNEDKNPIFRGPSTSMLTFAEKIGDISGQLPTKYVISRHLERFLSDKESMCYPIASASFTRCFKIIEEASDKDFGLQKGEYLSCYAVITGVCALMEFFECHQRGKESMRASGTTSIRLENIFLECLETLDRLGHRSVSRCLALHLQSRLYLLKHRIFQAWLAARNALQLAHFLHLDLAQHDMTEMITALSTLSSTHEKYCQGSQEELQLIWYAFLYEERNLSLMAEQPAMLLRQLDSQETERLLPTTSISVSADLAVFVQWRFRLSELLCEATRNCSKLSFLSRNVAEISRSLTIAKKIENFRLKHLPSDDLSSHYAFVPRYMIHSHSLQAQQILLRNCIKALSIGKDISRNQSFFEASELCVRAACADLRLRESFDREHLRVFGDVCNIPMYLQSPIRSTRWFNSLIICGQYVYSRTNGQSQSFKISEGLHEEISNHCKYYINSCCLEMQQGSHCGLEKFAQVVEFLLGILKGDRTEGEDTRLTARDKHIGDHGNETRTHSDVEADVSQNYNFFDFADSSSLDNLGLWDSSRDQIEHSANDFTEENLQNFMNTWLPSVII